MKNVLVNHKVQGHGNESAPALREPRQLNRLCLDFNSFHFPAKAAIPSIYKSKYTYKFFSPIFSRSSISAVFNKNMFHMEDMGLVRYCEILSAWMKSLPDWLVKMEEDMHELCPFKPSMVFFFLFTDVKK